MGIDDATDTDRAHNAWRDFTELLEGADAVLEWDNVALDDLDRAEGLRYLARLLEVGIGARLGAASPLKRHSYVA